MSIRCCLGPSPPPAALYCAVALLFTAALCCACGTSRQSGMQQPGSGLPGASQESGRPAAPVPAPAPDELSVPLPPGLPAPGRLLQAALQPPITATLAHGNEFDPGLPHSGVSVYGRRLFLETQPLPEGGTTQASAYATFRFRLPDYNGPARISIGGYVHAGYKASESGWLVTPRTWLALANWQSGRWEWHSPQANGVLELSGLAPYFTADGDLLLVWLYNGWSGESLDWLRIGNTAWQLEPLPGSVSQATPVLNFAADGSPLLALAGGGEGLVLRRRSGPGQWMTETLAPENHWNLILGLTCDGTGQVHLIAQRGYYPVPGEPAYRSERWHFQPGSGAAPRLLDHYTATYNNPPVPGVYPHYSHQWLNASAGAELAFTGGYKPRDMAVYRGGGWSVAQAELIDPQFRWDGRILALEGGPLADGQPATLYLAEQTGESWRKEVVTHDWQGTPHHGHDNSRAAYLLHHGSAWRVLARRKSDMQTILLHPAEGAWQAEPLQLAGFPDYRIPGPGRAASLSGGVLRFCSSSHIYTQAGWGTVTDLPIEVPGQWLIAAAFDATGRLHVVADEGGFGLAGLWYSAEPE